MEQVNETTMEIARALMDLFPGLELIDAVCMAKHQNITYARHS